MAPARKTRKKTTPAVTLPVLFEKRRKLQAEKEPEEEPSSRNASRSPSPPPASSSQHTSLSSTRQAREVILNPGETLPGLPTEELVKRLKLASEYLQTLKQQEKAGEYQEFLPFAGWIVSEEFTSHASKDVRILVACCVADIFRIFAPEAPYKSDGTVKGVLTFLAAQLEGLRDVNSVTFKRYYYLLENLSIVHVFVMAYDLQSDEEGEQILLDLFEVVFKTIRDDHSPSLKARMIDLLNPLINEGGMISFELLDIVLQYLLEPSKTSKPSAFKLAKDLIFQCADILETPLNTLFSTLLTCTSSEEVRNLKITARKFELVGELYAISPSLVSKALPQLEYCLKNVTESDRLEATKVCSKLFSQPDSAVGENHAPLWLAYIGRFNDISVEIRNHCVNSALEILIHHSHLRKDLSEALRARVYDGEESVRLNAIKCLVSAAVNTNSFDYVTGSSSLMDCLKDRTLDKKPKVRIEALKGLGQIYKYFMDEGKDPPTWLAKRILEGYYHDEVEDRVVIERQFNSCLVPYKMPVRERVVQLTWLISSLDNSQYKSFVEIQKVLMTVRSQFLGLVKCVRSPNPNKELHIMELNKRISLLAKFCPANLRPSEHLASFVQDLKASRQMLDMMDTFTDSKSDCARVGETANKILKKMEGNSYYAALKVLMGRGSAVQIDHTFVRELVKLVKRFLSGEESEDSEEDQDPLMGKKFPRTEIVIEKSCRLLWMLSGLYPVHCDQAEVMKMLLEVLQMENLDRLSSSNLLAAFGNVGRLSRPLGQHEPDLMEQLAAHCQNLVENCSPRQAKMAVRCLHANLAMDEEQRKNVFSDILELISPNLQNPNSSLYSTAVVTLGHVALLMGSDFKRQLKQLISRHVVKVPLTSPPRTAKDAAKNMDNAWVDFEKLPVVTQSMILAMKTLARWLVGQKMDVESATRAFKMLTGFVETGGTMVVPQSGDNAFPFTHSEQAHLRLAAGCATLKIAREKTVGDQFTCQTMYSLGQLMQDEVPYVRFKFAAKLHKGLSRGLPDKCLPNDFLGLFCWAAMETDRKQRQTLKSYLQTNIRIRREYVKDMMLNHPDKEMAANHALLIQPDMAIAFAVSFLANDAKLRDLDSLENLKEVEKCLWYLMEPLLSAAAAKREGNPWGWYKKTVLALKNKKNAVDPEDDAANVRLWTVCDVALDLLIRHEKSTGELDAAVGRIFVPNRYYVNEQNGWQNTTVYLSQEYLNKSKKTPRRPALTRTPKQDAAGGTPRARARKRTRNDSNEEVEKEGQKEQEEDVDEAISRSKKTMGKRTRLTMTTAEDEDNVSTDMEENEEPTPPPEEDEENKEPTPPLEEEEEEEEESEEIPLATPPPPLRRGRKSNGKVESNDDNKKKSPGRPKRTVTVTSASKKNTVDTKKNMPNKPVKKAKGASPKIKLRPRKK